MGRAVAYPSCRAIACDDGAVSRWEETMLDVVYVLGTIVFFAAMVAYGLACQALGRDQEHEDERS